GNIRELENAIEQAVALSYQSVLTPDDLPEAVRDYAVAKSFQPDTHDEQFLFPDTPTLEEVKKRYVLHVLKHNQGNVSRSARVLSIDRRSLYRMLARFKIERFSKQHCQGHCFSEVPPQLSSQLSSAEKPLAKIAFLAAFFLLQTESRRRR